MNPGLPTVAIELLDWLVGQHDLERTGPLRDRMQADDRRTLRRYRKRLELYGLLLYWTEPVEVRRVQRGQEVWRTDHLVHAAPTDLGVAFIRAYRANTKRYYQQAAK